MKKLIISLFCFLIFGIPSRDQSISCDLFIDPISEEYLNANGKNVIKDAINGSCYSLQFIVIFSENNTQQIDFINFKDAYDGAMGTPIRYVDDNDCWLTPFTFENNETFLNQNVITLFISIFKFC